MRRCSSAGPTSWPYCAPADVEIDSLISVPPRSLAPADRSSCASFGPSLTQEAWMFRKVGPSIRRASACIFTTSSPVAPGRTPGTSPFAHIGASEWLREVFADRQARTDRAVQDLLG